MTISFGSLELARTNPAHIGNAPLHGVDKVSGANKTGGVDRVTDNVLVEKTSENKATFASLLSDAVNEMNSQQLNVATLQEQVITDPDSVDIHDVTTAMAKAQMSLSLAQTVIDRVVKGWNDLSQNR